MDLAAWDIGGFNSHISQVLHTSTIVHIINIISDMLLPAAKQTIRANSFPSSLHGKVPATAETPTAQNPKVILCLKYKSIPTHMDLAPALKYKSWTKVMTWNSNEKPQQVLDVLGSYQA